MNQANKTGGSHFEIGISGAAVFDEDISFDYSGFGDTSVDAEGS